MPLEIRELHIKVTVNEPSQDKEPAMPVKDPRKADDEKDAIIRQCVDEIIEIMNNKKER